MHKGRDKVSAFCYLYKKKQRNHEPARMFWDFIRVRTIRRLLTPLRWAMTICTVSQARSNTSHRRAYSLTARSMQATNSLILTARMRAESSSLTMFVILTTERKKLLRTARTSTTDTSTLTTSTETLSISIPHV